MAIETVGVVGAGTMGNGIAQTAAVAGLNVVMIDVSDAMLVSDTARFCMRFLERGQAPDGGAIHLLTRHLGEYRAKEIVFSNRWVEAAEAVGARAAEAPEWLEHQRLAVGQRQRRRGGDFRQQRADAHGVTGGFQHAPQGGVTIKITQ